MLWILKSLHKVSLSYVIEWRLSTGKSTVSASNYAQFWLPTSCLSARKRICGPLTWSYMCSTWSVKGLKSIITFRVAPIAYFQGLFLLSNLWHPICIKEPLRPIKTLLNLGCVSIEIVNLTTDVFCSSFHKLQSVLLKVFIPSSIGLRAFVIGVKQV